MRAQTATTSTTPSGSSTDTNFQAAAITQLLAQYGDLEQKVKLLDSSSKSEQETFRYILKNEKVIYWLLLLFPIVLLCTVVITMKISGDIVPSFVLYSVLGLIGIGTIVELFYLPVKISNYAQKVDKLEEDLNRIKNELNITS